MKIAVIIIRSLLGLMFLWASAAYFLKLYPTPVMTGSVKTFNEGIAASVYLMPFVKGVELICAILLLVGRYVALALVALFPIMLNIVCFHAFLQPEALPLVGTLLIMLLFLAYTQRAKYAPLFTAK